MMLDFHDAAITRVLNFVHQQATPAWLVGGAVRDYLLERPVHDLDFVVPEGGIWLARAVATAFRGGFFVLDHERDVGRAILHDDRGGPLYVDVACFRAPDLTGDLSYRDFTINAITLDLSAGLDSAHFVDPFDGRGDVERGVIRAVSEGTFLDDPLRMLRAVRQAAELDFRIEFATFNLIRRDAAWLPSVAAERTRDELMRIVTAPRAWQHVRTLLALDVLRHALPEAAALAGLAQSPPHTLDVFDHTRAVMAHIEGMVALLWPESGYRVPEPVEGDPVVISGPQRWHQLERALAPYADALRAHLLQSLAASRTRRDWLFWCALAHDWGKAVTGSRAPDGRIHFYEHEHKGASLAENRARALACAADETAYLEHMVGGHMRPGHLARDYPPSRRALYRFFRDMGSASPDAGLLSLADKMATHAPESLAEAVTAPAAGAWSWEHHLRVVELILGNYFGQRAAGEDAGAEAAGIIEVVPHPRPLLNGHEIMAEFGLPPGPAVGQLTEALREAQAIGEVSTREQARAWLGAHLAEIVGDGPLTAGEM